MHIFYEEERVEVTRGIAESLENIDAGKDGIEELVDKQGGEH